MKGSFVARAASPLALACLLLYSCATAPAPEKRVTTIVLNMTTLNMVVGGAPVGLFAYALPMDAADRAITWSTSDPGVATVDAAGTVAAVAPGSATVVATADGKSATCAVTVQRPSADIKVDKIEQYYYSSLKLYDTFASVYFTVTNTGKQTIVSDAVSLLVTCEDGTTVKGTGNGSDIAVGASKQFKAYIDVGARHVLSATVTDQVISYR